MTTDTLKQAAQALRNTRNPHVLDLVAALEAMAEMQPVAWMATRLHSVVIAAKREDLFALGQQQHISPLYAAPIATPEDDAKVRDAALAKAVLACLQYECKMHGAAANEETDKFFAGAAVGASVCIELINKIKSDTPPEKQMDCPHAAPFRYCPSCPVSPCPIGLKSTGADYE